MSVVPMKLLTIAGPLERFDDVDENQKGQYFF